MGKNGGCMSPLDADGNLWYPIEEYEEERNWVPTQEDLDETDADMKAWEESPEGQAFAAEVVEREAQRLDPNRLSNRVEFKELPLLFAQAVQSIYDETGKPCRLKEAGLRAGMDSDEYIVAAAFAHNQGLVRHPTISRLQGRLICTTLHEPGVG